MGPYVQHCPKAMPSFVPHNSQFTPPIEVILNIQVVVSFSLLSTLTL
jgi:hypothetical protein